MTTEHFPFPHDAMRQRAVLQDTGLDCHMANHGDEVSSYELEHGIGSHDAQAHVLRFGSDDGWFVRFMDLGGAWAEILRRAAGLRRAVWVTKARGIWPDSGASATELVHGIGRTDDDGWFVRFMDLYQGVCPEGHGCYPYAIDGVPVDGGTLRKCIGGEYVGKRLGLLDSPR